LQGLHRIYPNSSPAQVKWIVVIIVHTKQNYRFQSFFIERSKSMIIRRRKSQRWSFYIFSNMPTLWARVKNKRGYGPSFECKNSSHLRIHWMGGGVEVELQKVAIPKRVDWAKELEEVALMEEVSPVLEAQGEKLFRKRKGWHRHKERSPVAEVAPRESPFRDGSEYRVHYRDGASGRSQFERDS